MHRRRRAALLCSLGLVIAAGLSACTGFWNTPVLEPKLLVGPIVVTGTEGCILLSVAVMPDGGLASIQFGTVGDEAINFIDIEAASIVIEGKNGFAVLAEDFTTTAGKGAFLAANASTGVLGGEILKIIFTIDGANPSFTIDDTKVTLGDDSDELIPVIWADRRTSNSGGLNTFANGMRLIKTRWARFWIVSARSVYW